MCEIRNLLAPIPEGTYAVTKSKNGETFLTCSIGEDGNPVPEQLVEIAEMAENLKGKCFVSLKVARDRKPFSVGTINILRFVHLFEAIGIGRFGETEDANGGVVLSMFSFARKPDENEGNYHGHIIASKRKEEVVSFDDALLLWGSAQPRRRFLYVGAVATVFLDKLFTTELSGDVPAWSSGVDTVLQLLEASKMEHLLREVSSASAVCGKYCSGVETLLKTAQADLREYVLQSVLDRTTALRQQEIMARIAKAKERYRFYQRFADFA